jgi:hypothetical protein
VEVSDGRNEVDLLRSVTQPSEALRGSPPSLKIWERFDLFSVLWTKQLKCAGARLCGLRTV